MTQNPNGVHDVNCLIVVERSSVKASSVLQKNFKLYGPNNVLDYTNNNQTRWSPEVTPAMTISGNGGGSNTKGIAKILIEYALIILDVQSNLNHYRCNFKRGLWQKLCTCGHCRYQTKTITRQRRHSAISHRPTFSSWEQLCEEEIVDDH
jgi:hypothetical protein